MVTSSAPVPAVRSRPHQVCPRCEASLIMTYNEPECIQCGFVDYKYVPPTPISAKKPDEFRDKVRLQVHRRLSESQGDAR